MRRLQQLARAVAPLFIASGALAFGYAAFVLLDAWVYQVDETARFERVVAAAPADAAAPELAEGVAIGEIQIPRLGLSAIVAQGESTATLEHAVGHLPDTALPGQTGNVVLAGHRDTFFRPLRFVRAGDVIVLRTHGGDFQYLVELTAVVPRDDVAVLEPTSGRTLTLITCHPFVYVGAAPDRFIVRAREVNALSAVQ